ncbi:MAG: DUF1810 domain-containing protein [Vicinamibacterales bacterium]
MDRSTPADHAYDLERFVHAQTGIYEQALAEVTRGHKQSHWMWFVFPQIAGLGLSDMSRRYAISSPGEARAYLDHPVLGPRLQACFAATLGVTGRSAHDIFGSPDDLKLRSCATLFAAVSDSGSVFQQVLDRYFDGAADDDTQRLTAPADRCSDPRGVAG